MKPLMRFFPPLITGTVVSLYRYHPHMPVSMDWGAGGAGATDYASGKISVLPLSSWSLLWH